MNVQHVTPILNVSNLEESFAWFAKLGWRKAWEYGEPPDFGAVASGRIEIFLCTDGQGCRGGPEAERTWDHTGGGWVTWWLATPAEVDEAHARAVAADCLVTWPPTDMPWNVRECHIRHPDGHTFRVSASLEEDE